MEVPLSVGEMETVDEFTDIGSRLVDFDKVEVLLQVDTKRDWC